MKNPHEMTRLELEQEVIESRNQIRNLQSKINNLKYQISIYKDIKEQSKIKKLRKDWYD